MACGGGCWLAPDQVHLLRGIGHTNHLKRVGAGIVYDHPRTGHQPELPHGLRPCRGRLLHQLRCRIADHHGGRCHPEGVWPGGAGWRRDRSQTDRQHPLVTASLRLCLCLCLPWPHSRKKAKGNMARRRPAKGCSRRIRTECRSSKKCTRGGACRHTTSAHVAAWSAMLRQQSLPPADGPEVAQNRPREGSVLPLHAVPMQHAPGEGGVHRSMSVCVHPPTHGHRQSI